MAWLDLVLKFIPTLINFILELVKGIKDKEPAAAGFTDVPVVCAEDLVCQGIDKTIAELTATKAKLQAAKVV